MSKTSLISRSREVDSAIDEIRNLKAAIAEARTQIADCLQKRAVEKEMLASLKAQPTTDGNKEYQRLAARACRLGIKAWNLSVVAFESDIAEHQLRIDEIQGRVPEARMDH